ncbi:hypothetical protein [Jiangella rhizosphaerae]|uniref:Uncharacterized protein n=1 Tax=Jiangella rhizosphaerae TaxID=2293569 RepID=A0A418KHT8_9ACTN|nr:hypothetical protein [Jiangella rhizosphaerae]RIQ11881.1 hypothetical protein DY240_27935 [Jiangella rhizosphaerae]
MTTQEQEAGERRWAPTYRAHCPRCRQSGRAFSSYGNAEDAARGHAGKHNHTTHVVDQYGIRVVGSTQRPGDDLASH